MLDTIQYKRLVDIAFLAASKGFPGEAGVILDGLDMVLPDSSETAICRAITQYGTSDFGKAHETLGALLEADPGNEFALAHLGILYHLGGESDVAREKLELVVNGGKDEQAVALAKAMLEDVL